MTKNIAHRGYSHIYPENTMLAFQKAVEAHCDGIELDVHFSRDGQIVVIHDENLDRTTNGKGNVWDYTAEQLRTLDAGAGFAGRYGISPIPTLKEYFEYIKDKDVFTNIEIKNGIHPYPGLEQKLIEMIRRFDLDDKIIFSSFNHYSMVACKRLAPHIPVALLTSSWMVGAGAYARGLNAEFVNPRYQSLTDEALKELAAHGVQVQAWTINNEDVMRAMIQQGIYGVITDRPDVMHSVLLESRNA